MLDLKALPSAASQLARWQRGPLGFLRRHPLLFLLLLSPGIPEYLSGSSPVQALIINPGLFAFQIVGNLGLYGPGVLLVREAMVRWRKGWATVLLLGAAYGILEEGVALSTLFNPAAGPVGVLGFFGHWLGVSWVWTEGVLFVHMIYSISLPILLVGLTIPETRGKSLLGKRGVSVALIILGADVLLLAQVVASAERFWMGVPLLLGSFIAIFTFVFLGRRAGVGWPGKRQKPEHGQKTTLAVGILVFPGILASQALGAFVGLPALVVFLFVLAMLGLLLRWVVRNLSFPGNERRLVTFTLGLVIPLFASGILSQFPIEIVLAPDVALALLFANLLRMYPAERKPTTTRAELGTTG